MANRLNREAFEFAKNKIQRGDYKIEREWNPPDPELENRYIAENGWSAFSRWFLGFDDEVENEETKARWKYPFTDDFKAVSRNGLVAIRQRAGQQGDDDIFEAAGKLIEMIDEREAKAFQTVVYKEADGDTITAIVSREVVDRSGDVVKIDGIRLENYLKNPIVLFNHDRDKVIGKTIDLSKSNDALLARIKFANTPLAREVRDLVREGFLNTLSFGFIPIEYVPGAKGLVYNSVELLEISIVSIPANPEAIVLRYIEDRLNARAISLQNAISEEKIRKMEYILERLRRTNRKLSNGDEEKIKAVVGKIKNLLKLLE